MTADRFLQISQLAEEAGVTVRAVRYYEEIGLLRPAALTAGGMRLYGASEVGRLRFIRRLRALRLSLEEIKLALGVEQPTQDRKERVERTLHVLEMEQTRLAEQMAALDQLQKEVDEALSKVDRCTQCSQVQCPSGCPRQVYLV